jgi:alpha-L-rhamnosidase
MKSKKIFVLLLGVVLPAAAWGQTVSPALLERVWPAKWVTHPSASPTDFGVFHFRKAFSLATEPERFIVHVSADNRYRLFINGKSVATGPGAIGIVCKWSLGMAGA